MTDNTTKTEQSHVAADCPNELLVIRNARIRGTHHYSFRTGEWAEILNVVVCKPKGLNERAAFECRYDDGKLDYIPVDDLSNYEISV